ncbi:MAG: M16 family metallopeptidase [Pseudobdellovibrionaceae bacterium]
MKFVFSTLIIFVSAFTLSCASGSKKSSSGSDFEMRKYREQVLPNGLTLILIEDASLPKVTLSMVFKTGVMQQGTLPGLNSLTSELLERGTERKSAKTIADDFGQLGTALSIAPNEDYVQISSTALSQNASSLLEVFSDVILNPLFSEAELQKLKAEMSSRIKQEADNPSVVIDRAFAKYLYGTHPYGQAATLASVAKIRRADVIRHHSRYFRPNNAYLAVVGNYSHEFVTQVVATFGAWESRTIEKQTSQPLAESKFKKLQLVSKPGLQQSQIAMGHLGIKRDDPDFLALRTGGLILGGAFASRLNQKIRDDLGLTYNIRASFEPGLDRGTFEIRTFTRQEQTTDVIVETKKVIQEFVDKGITEKELAAAKALLIGQFPGSVETPEMLAARLVALRVYGIGDEYLKNFLDLVNALTVEQVNAAMKKHLHPENIQVVVYGNEQAMPASLGKTFSVEKSTYAP